MKNKIPQEIEENRKMCSNWYEEGYNDGFKAGQKQTNEEVLKLIDERIRYYEDEEIKQRELTKGYEGLSDEEEGALQELRELKSKLTEEEKEDDK